MESGARPWLREPDSRSPEAGLVEPSLLRLKRSAQIAVISRQSHMDAGS